MMRSFLITLGVLLTVWVLIPAPHQPHCPVGFDVDAECRHFNQAMDLADHGKSAEAIREYQIAICLDPEDELAKHHLDELLQERSSTRYARID